MVAVKTLPELGRIPRMSSRQHAEANAVAFRPAAFHSRPDVAARIAATQRAMRAFPTVLLVPHPPTDKRPAPACKPAADELVLRRLQAAHPGEELSDEVLIKHLRAEMRRLHTLASRVSHMSQQAKEQFEWLQAEAIRTDQQLHRLQDAAAQHEELVELCEQNRLLRLEVDTTLQDQENRAIQTVAMMSENGVQQTAALSANAAAHLLALLRQGFAAKPDDLAIESLRRQTPNITSEQIVRHLRAEVKRLGQELSGLLILDNQAHNRVTKAEKRLRAQTQRLQRLGGDAALLKKVAVASAQNALLRRLVQQSPETCNGVSYESPATVSDDKAAAIEVIGALAMDDREALLLNEQLCAEPFMRAVKERQTQRERDEMISAATTIAAAVRGKVARARAKSVRAKLLALDAFMDSLVDRDNSDEEEGLGIDTTTVSKENNDNNGNYGETNEIVMSPATNWAEQMMLDIGLHIEEEEEQAAVRIQAAHRGKLARKKQNLRTMM